MTTLTFNQQIHIRNLELALDRMTIEQKDEMLLKLAKLTLEQQNIAIDLFRQVLGIQEG